MTGIDINRSSIKEAASLVSKQHQKILKFRECDGRNVYFAKNRAYQYATISLALHEMPEKMRIPVLNEMKRVAVHLVIADYSTPLPKNLAGLLTFFIEIMAGRAHFNGFKTYQKSGGLNYLLKEAGLTVKNEHSVLRGVIRIVEV